MSLTADPAAIPDIVSEPSDETVGQQVSDRELSVDRQVCHDIFASLPRSDQRRWGEVYVRGLATLDGRKSIRRIAEQVAGYRAEQCLQQFVNQSPWDWEPVRYRLADLMAVALRPRAWVLQEAVFPKNGTSSVGVAKQFVPSLGATMNCQLALTVLLAGERGSCPVNWRLMLPRSWDDDERRANSHVPDGERHRSRWQHLLDALDEMVISWGMNPQPVLLDAHTEPDVETLVAGLERRSMRYLIRVHPANGLNLRPAPGLRAGEPHRRRPALAASTGDLPDRADLRHRPPVGAERSVSGSHAPGPESTLSRPVRRILLEPPSRHGRRSTWLTNLRPGGPDPADLIRLVDRSHDDLTSIGEESGLSHFEGRSYRGWHHHVTLASVAHAVRLLARLNQEVA